MNTFKKRTFAFILAGLACLACSAHASGPPIDTDPGARASPAPAAVSPYVMVASVPVATLDFFNLQHQRASAGENAREAAPRLGFALHFTNPGETGDSLSSNFGKSRQLAHFGKLTRMPDRTEVTAGGERQTRVRNSRALPVARWA